MIPTFSIVFCLVLLSAVMASTQLDPALLESLSGGKTARLRVSMTCPSPELVTFKGDSIEVFLEDPNVEAARCQATVLNLLESEKSRLAVTWESLWLDQTIVNGADLKLANDIAALENVAKIEDERFVKLI